MSRLVDLTGQRFGKLLVLKRAEKPNNVKGTQAYWECLCDCGKIKIVMGSNLRRGLTTSCGQCNEVTIGRVFGKLTVVEFVGTHTQPSGAKIKMWRCACECGGFTITSTANLLSSHSKSCGCSRLDNLIGQRFGFVEVLDRAETASDKNTRWNCLCHNCGGRFSTFASTLKSGIVSCGCVRSKGELRVSEILSNLNIDFVKNEHFNLCRSPKTNSLLPFDFYLASNNLIVEFDGRQHEKAEAGSGWNTPQQHEEIVYRDNIKNRWCKENNKQLIRIPYTELPRIDAAYMLTLMRLAAMEEDEELVCPA
jgi:hypothetical protein